MSRLLVASCYDTAAKVDTVDSSVCGESPQQSFLPSSSLGLCSGRVRQGCSESRVRHSISSTLSNQIRLLTFTHSLYAEFHSLGIFLYLTSCFPRSFCFSSVHPDRPFGAAWSCLVRLSSHVILSLGEILLRSTRWSYV